MSEQIETMRFEIDKEEVKRIARKEVLDVQKELAEEEGVLTPARLQEMLDELEEQDSVI